MREGSPCDLPLLHPPKDPDEYGVDVRDTPLNREDIKEGVKHLVDLNPPVLRQKDRGKSLARTSGRFPLRMAPGIFKFVLLFANSPVVGITVNTPVITAAVQALAPTVRKSPYAGRETRHPPEATQPSAR